MSVIERKPLTSVRAATNQFFDDMTEPSERKLMEIESETLQELQEMDMNGCLEAHQCGEIELDHLLTWMKLDIVESLYFMGAGLEDVVEFLDVFKAEKILRINMVEKETFAGGQTVWGKHRIVWRVHGRNSIRMLDGGCKFRVNTDVTWYTFSSTRPQVVSVFTRVCAKDDVVVDKTWHKRIEYPDQE